MTPAHREYIASHGPFKLRGNTVYDVNGFALWSCQPPATDIDRAMVAALNEVVKIAKVRP